MQNTNDQYGFEDVKPMVFAGIYPVDTEDYEDLRNSMETAIERRFTCILPESSAALGFGFRCGFAHGNYPRTFRAEFNMTVITTVLTFPILLTPKKKKLP
jgi:GTP-binding protein LepA